MSDYIPEGHDPYASSVRSLYVEANKELLMPFPSVPLRNFPMLTHMTGGFRPYEFTILCGATGSGKTTLAANISRSLIEQDVPHFVASVETGHTDFVKRVISSLAGKDWNSGEAVPVSELKEFDKNHGSMFTKDTLQLSLYDNRFSVGTLMSDIAWMVKHKGVKLAIVDNMNFFLEVTSADRAIVEMDRVIHELIMFCKRVPIHVVMVMHPKKTEGGYVADEFSVKGSSTAVQEAHNVLLWNRPHPELLSAKIAEPGDRELMIAKMRRKGKFVRRRLIMRAIDGVSYVEKEIV